MIDTDKLDNAILKHLRVVDGRKDASVVWWQSLIQGQVGKPPDYAEVVSAMKRLRDDGVVRLRKYFRELGGLSEYRGNGDDAADRQFFGFATFEVLITDQGRRLWNVPSAPIGFQRPT